MLGGNSLLGNITWKHDQLGNTIINLESQINLEAVVLQMFPSSYVFPGEKCFQVMFPSKLLPEWLTT